MHGKKQTNLVFTLVASIAFVLFFGIQANSESNKLLNLDTAKKSEILNASSKLTEQPSKKDNSFSFLMEEMLEEEDKRSKKTKKSFDNYSSESKASYCSNCLLQEVSKIKSYFQTYCPNQIPLYTLFHSWKVFLIFYR